MSHRIKERKYYRLIEKYMFKYNFQKYATPRLYYLHIEKCYNNIVATYKNEPTLPVRKYI